MLSKKELKIKKNYIGGSEVHHVLNLDPYGCARWLWYDKRDYTEDYPVNFEDNPHIKRGNALEPLVRKMLSKKYGIKLKKPKPSISSQYPFMRASGDTTFISKTMGGEIKCPGLRHFLKIKKEGIPQSWIVQEQHYMSVCDSQKWLSAIFSAELWELLTFEVARDDDLIAFLIQAEEDFWKMVTEGPAPEQLEDEEDKRCVKCSYRKTCGRDNIEIEMLAEGEIDVSANAEYIEAIAEYNNAKEVKQEAESLINEAKEKLEKILGTNKKMRGLGMSCWWQQSSSLDKEKLCNEHPEIELSKYYKLGKQFLNIR